MRFFTYLSALLFAVFLSACGGGGGSSGTISGPTTPLKIIAPSAVTIAPGAAANYAISGGKSPYRAVSDNIAIARVAIVDNSTLVVGAVAVGGSKVQVFDANGNAAELTITVFTGSTLALYTTAPSALTMVPGITRSFEIGGGTAPYTVTSDNTFVATVDKSSGTTLTIVSGRVGVASIKITDLFSKTINVALTVASGGVPLSASPTTASSYIDMPVEVFLVGGTPPYRLGGLIPAAATVVRDAVDSSKFVVTPLLVSSGLDITFLDSQDASTKFTLTGIAGQPTIRLSPNAVAVSEIDTQSITLTLYGTGPGAVNVFSSDARLLAASVDPADRTKIKVTTGSQGNRCVLINTSVTITAVDSNNSLATSVFTIVDNGNRVFTTTDTSTDPPTVTSVTTPCPT